uniref:Uncharacterized protein n=1 Tax=Anopheles darlingi TaxID=43151 RepID=A0A2M4DH44_ANODA
MLMSVGPSLHSINLLYISYIWLFAFISAVIKVSETFIQFQLMHLFLHLSINICAKSSVAAPVASVPSCFSFFLSSITFIAFCQFTRD